jgi:heparosan-N-sulfate-glucuronate 5-epimerase
MAGINNDITLGVGNISLEPELKSYYQDVSPSLAHIEGGVFADFDEDGIPYCIEGDVKKYYIVTIIQYALICYDFIQKAEDVSGFTIKFLKCINWLEKKKEVFGDSYVFRSEENYHYNLEAGWVSGMYQGQAISLYLRAYQLTGDDSYLMTAETVFNSFKYDYSEGGFKRIDEKGFLWFEEYPTEKPSYVLNGFIYSMFGLLDLYRVTGNSDAKEMWDECVKTVENNLYKYDVWYWSVYDQLKKELVSYYYQKNVHVPLMQILYCLTGRELFGFYAVKWEKNLKSPFNIVITKIMYRIRPRIFKLKNIITK